MFWEPQRQPEGPGLGPSKPGPSSCCPLASVLSLPKDSVPGKGCPSPLSGTIKTMVFSSATSGATSRIKPWAHCRPAQGVECVKVPQLQGKLHRASPHVQAFSSMALPSFVPKAHSLWLLSLKFILSPRVWTNQAQAGFQINQNRGKRKRVLFKPKKLHGKGGHVVK